MQVLRTLQSKPCSLQTPANNWTGTGTLGQPTHISEGTSLSQNNSLAEITKRSCLRAQGKNMKFVLAACPPLSVSLHWFHLSRSQGALQSEPCCAVFAQTTWTATRIRWKSQPHTKSQIQLSKPPNMIYDTELRMRAQPPQSNPNHQKWYTSFHIADSTNISRPLIYKTNIALYATNHEHAFDRTTNSTLNR